MMAQCKESLKIAFFSGKIKMVKIVISRKKTKVKER